MEQTRPLGDVAHRLRHLVEARVVRRRRTSFRPREPGLDGRRRTRHRHRARAELIAAFDPETVRVHLQTAHKAATVNEQTSWEINQEAHQSVFNSPTFANVVSAFEGRGH